MVRPVLSPAERDLKRLIQSRGTVDLSDYGASGDGVSDDTAAFQAAVDAVAGTGKILTGNGVYLLQSPVVPPAGRFELWGVHLVAGSAFPSGRAMVEFNRSGTFPHRDVSLVDCYFDGAQNAETLLEVTGTIRFKIRNCRFYEFSDVGISIPDTYQTHEITITGSSVVGVVDGPKGSGVGIGVDLVGTDHRIVDTEFAYCDTGIRLTSAMMNQVSGCHIYGCTTAGVHIVDGSFALGTQLRIDECYIDNNPIVIESCEYVAIADCQFLSTFNNQEFIVLKPQSSSQPVNGLCITNNQFRTNLSYSSTCVAVDTTDGTLATSGFTYNTWSGNTLSNVTSVGDLSWVTTGFYDTAPVERADVSGTTTRSILDDLVTSLSDYGLISDSTTPDTGAWTAWSPTFTGITAGNGTVSARYRVDGRTLHWHYQLVLGSTSAVGTNPKLSTPSGWEVYNTVQTYALGKAFAYDSSAGAFFEGGCYGFGDVLTTRIIFGSTTVDAATPFTWAAGDRLVASGTCEVEPA